MRIDGWVWGWEGGGWAQNTTNVSVFEHKVVRTEFSCHRAYGEELADYLSPSRDVSAGLVMGTSPGRTPASEHAHLDCRTQWSISNTLSGPHMLILLSSAQIRGLRAILHIQAVPLYPSGPSRFLIHSRVLAPVANT